MIRQLLARWRHRRIIRLARTHARERFTINLAPRDPWRHVSKRG